jgi:antitoxin component YwqK of YwqJK toxin-antitoxin module
MCNVIAAVALGLLLPLLVYRLLWRHRYGRTGVEGYYLRLHGRVCRSGATHGELVCRDSPGGGVTHTEPFELETARERYPVEIPGQVVLRGGPIRVGDRITLDALHTTLQVDEALYRESACKPAVAALRISRGSWPELRLLDPVIGALALTAIGALLAAVPARRQRAAALHLPCPPRTREGGGPPPMDHFQWCEVDRGKDAVLGAQESVKHGPWVAWWDRNHLRQVGQFFAGRPEGQWLSYHRNGRVAVEARYRAGRRVGRWSSWRPDGSLRERGRYSEKGPRQGSWSSFDPNGRLRLRRYYHEGVPHGSWTGWHPDGRIAFSQGFDKGLRHGAWRRWQRDGQLVEAGQYAAGKKVEQWSVWQADGRLSRQGGYQDGVRHGSWRFWHPNGQLQAAGSYAQGEPDGGWSWWHASGKMAGRGSYAQGVKQGRWVAWPDPEAIAATATASR